MRIKIQLDYLEFLTTHKLTKHEIANLVTDSNRMCDETLYSDKFSYLKHIDRSVCCDEIYEYKKSYIDFVSNIVLESLTEDKENA